MLILEFFGTFVWLSFLTKNEWSKELDCLMHWLFSVQWHQPKMTQELIKIMSKKTFQPRYDMIRYSTIRYGLWYDTCTYDTIRYDTIRCDKVTYTSRINMRVGFVRLYTKGRILTSTFGQNFDGVFVSTVLRGPGLWLKILSRFKINYACAH